MNIKLTHSDLYGIGFRRYIKPRELKAFCVLMLGVVLAALILFVTTADNTGGTNYRLSDNSGIINIEWHQGYIVLDNQVLLKESNQQSLVNNPAALVVAILPVILGFSYWGYVYRKADQEGIKFQYENTVLK